MSFNYTPGGDLSAGGNWLDEPGTYHLVVDAVDERPSKRDGSPINNAAFKVELKVLAGTTPNQQDKTTDIMFFHGSGKDTSIAFAKKKFDRFFVATNLLTTRQIEAKEDATIDLQNARSQQIIAKFVKEADQHGKERLQLHFADIWHIDDPAVKDVPKQEQALRIILPEHRWASGKSADKPPQQQTWDNL